MATYYVGPGGSNANAGTSWALRKLTLNGAEDIGLLAGDVVYVGPGTYRELLTVDSSGSVGNPITYIADVTGEHTDGVGGVVRITGSDDDQTRTRANCIYGTGRSYRTFRGFALDIGEDLIKFEGAGSNLVIEDCTFQGIELGFGRAINITGSITDGVTIRRCVVVNSEFGVHFEHAAQTNMTNTVIDNCLIVANLYGVRTNSTGGVAIRNCTIMGNYAGVRVDSYTSHAANTIVNSIVTGNFYGLYSSGAGGLTEDYNAVMSNSTERNNVTAGANSNTYAPLLDFPLLASGYKWGAWFGDLAPYSPLRARAGSVSLTEDLYGVPRPGTASKLSWGAVQYADVERETVTVNTAPASLALPDAGRVQFIVPHDGTQLTISVEVYREANYAGTNPQMVIRQPGQSARTTTDAGLAGAWNTLTDTFTPASAPGYVIVELVSNNTAASGSYATYFDDLAKG